MFCSRRIYHCFLLNKGTEFHADSYGPGRALADAWRCSQILDANSNRSGPDRALSWRDPPEMGLDLRQESLPSLCDNELLVLTVGDPVQHPQFYEELDVLHRLSVAQISRIEQLRLGGRSRRDAQNISDYVESSSSRQSVLDVFLAKINVLELCSYAEAQFLTFNEMNRGGS